MPNYLWRHRNDYAERVYILSFFYEEQIEGSSISLEAVDQKISAFYTMPYFDDVIGKIWRHDDIRKFRFLKVYKVMTQWRKF